MAPLQMNLWSCGVFISLKSNFIDHKKKTEVYTSLVYLVMYEKILDLKEVEIAFFIFIQN